MLRITTHDNPDCLTFQLEGKLAGPWVRELEDCWQKTLAGRVRPVVRVDLRGVTFLDVAGKTLLAELHARGAEFVAVGCAMKAVVAEVTGTPLPAHGCPEEKGERRLEERPTAGRHS
jgi:anti-anti-sigma regulatory factor